MANKLETNLPDIEVLTRTEMLKTINDQLHRLLAGGGFNAAALFVIAGSMLTMGAMFSLMMHERRREFGLLQAMGARRTFILPPPMSKGITTARTIRPMAAKSRCYLLAARTARCLMCSAPTTSRLSSCRTAAGCLESTMESALRISSRLENTARPYIRSLVTWHETGLSAQRMES